jgi:hypothetical protein
LVIVIGTIVVGLIKLYIYAQMNDIVDWMNENAHSLLLHKMKHADPASVRQFEMALNCTAEYHPHATDYTDYLKVH